LRIAGAAETGLFAPDALRLVFQYSRGIPRLINIICDRALVVGYVEDARRIEGVIVEDAVADLEMELQEPSAPKASPKLSDRILMEIGARMERVEQSVKNLTDALADSGVIRQGLTSSSPEKAPPNNNPTDSKDLDEVKE
jgi:general secretion pathway protein A